MFQKMLQGGSETQTYEIVEKTTQSSANFVVTSKKKPKYISKGTLFYVDYTTEASLYDVDNEKLYGSTNSITKISDTQWQFGAGSSMQAEHMIIFIYD